MACGYLLCLRVLLIAAPINPSSAHAIHNRKVGDCDVSQTVLHHFSIFPIKLLINELLPPSSIICKRIILLFNVYVCVD